MPLNYWNVLRKYSKNHNEIAFGHLQHCKPAVDDETFKKMVDRQYELMRRPRLIDEMNNSKNPARSEDVDMHSVDQPAPNTATEAPVTDHEVCHVPKWAFSYLIAFCLLNRL